MKGLDNVADVEVDTKMKWRGRRDEVECMIKLEVRS